MIGQLTQDNALGVQYVIADSHGVALANIQSLVDSFGLTANKRVGSLACRKLLGLLQKQMGIAGQLQDQQLPYRIVDCGTNGKTQSYYISFSHSRKQAAVLIAQTQHLGIDIEDKPIGLAVAQRYFSANEMAWLLRLPQGLQLEATKLLWVLKEAHIKQQGNSGIAMTLTRGLKHNMLTSLGETGLNQLLAPRSITGALPIAYPAQPDTDLTADPSILTACYYYWPEQHCGYVIAEKIT